MTFSNELGQKIFKGCGCLSIGFVVLLTIFVVVALCMDDEEEEDGVAQTEQTGKAEQKDSTEFQQ